MELLNVDNLFPKEEDYNQTKLTYIANYQTYVPGSFLSLGYYENRPQAGEANWNSSYPKGYQDWLESTGRVSYGDLKILESKINELITLWNNER